MTEPSRLHPLTLVFEAIRVGRSFLLPAALGGASAAGDSLPQLIGLGVAFLTIPALIAAVAKYVSFRYFLGGEELVLNSGVLRRTRRVIPLARIQNIDIQQSALQRLCGVAELRVETAGGSDTEAVLTVLALPDAEALRSELLARRHAAVGAAPADPEAPPTTVLARLSVADLALAGATANEIGLVAAILGGAFNFLVQLPFSLPLPQMDPTTLMPASPAVVAAVLITGLVVLFLVLGWFFSVAGAVISHYGFTLERTEDELRKQYGLLQRRSVFLPLRRIQAVRVEESVLRRRLKLATLKVESAGGAPGQRQRGGAEAFVPITRLPQVPDLISAVLPAIDFASLEFQPVHPRARRRAFVRYAAPVLLLAVALAIVLGRQWLWLLALLLAAWGAAGLHYRHLAYALAPGYVIARSGFWNRITWVVPEHKIQTLHVWQTPFQRRHRLASLIVDTAAGQAVILDLHQDDAHALLARIARNLSLRRVHAGAPAVLPGLV